MKKFLFLGFCGLLFLVTMAFVVGCGQVANTIAVTLDDASVIGTSEVTLSGALSYSGGTVDINLGAVIISGEAQTLTTGKVRVRVGGTLATITSASPLEFTLPAVTSRAIDMAFILDNTESMSSAITGSKNSINEFAASLEAAGADVKFGIVTFGDSPYHPTLSSESYPTTEADPTWDDGNAHARPVMNFGTAAALKNILSTEVYAEGGADLPENPLDAILYAYNNFSWRAAAQRVFVVITDAAAHQLGVAGTDNYCTTTGTAVVSTLEGRAVVYAVSPVPADITAGYLDVRRLADGFAYGSVTAESNTGGKWIEFNAGSFNLTNLGITTTVTTSYTVRFSYSFEAGTYYIWLEVDTDGDGDFDSNMVIRVVVTGSSSIASAAAVSAPVSNDVTKGIPTIYINKPVKASASSVDRRVNQN